MTCAQTEVSEECDGLMMSEERGWSGCIRSIEKSDVVVVLGIGH